MKCLKRFVGSDFELHFDFIMLHACLLQKPKAVASPRHCGEKILDIIRVAVKGTHSLRISLACQWVTYSTQPADVKSPHQTSNLNFSAVCRPSSSPSTKCPSSSGFAWLSICLANRWASGEAGWKVNLVGNVSKIWWMLNMSSLGGRLMDISQ